MKKVKRLKLNLTGEKPFEGNSIEQEMRIATASKQPIKNSQISNVFYTQRKDGVLPECDIRTDRFELAQQAMQKVNQEFHKKIKERIEQQNETQTDKKQTE